MSYRLSSSSTASPRPNSSTTLYSARSNTTASDNRQQHTTTTSYNNNNSSLPSSKGPSRYADFTNQVIKNQTPNGYRKPRTLSSQLPFETNYNSTASSQIVEHSSRGAYRLSNSMMRTNGNATTDGKIAATSTSAQKSSLSVNEERTISTRIGNSSQGRTTFNNQSSSYSTAHDKRTDSTRRTPSSPRSSTNSSNINLTNIGQLKVASYVEKQRIAREKAEMKRRERTQGITGVAGAEEESSSVVQSSSSTTIRPKPLNNFDDIPIRSKVSSALQNQNRELPSSSVPTTLCNDMHTSIPHYDNSNPIEDENLEIEEEEEEEPKVTESIDGYSGAIKSYLKNINQSQTLGQPSTNRIENHTLTRIMDNNSRKSVPKVPSYEVSKRIFNISYSTSLLDQSDMEVPSALDLLFKQLTIGSPYGDDEVNRPTKKEKALIGSVRSKITKPTQVKQLEEWSMENDEEKGKNELEEEYQEDFVVPAVKQQPVLVKENQQATKTNSVTNYPPRSQVVNNFGSSSPVDVNELPDEKIVLVECGTCGRKFNSERIRTHEAACSKPKKVRKQYQVNIVPKELQKDWLESKNKSNQSNKKPEAKQSGDTRTECPYCHRKFADEPYKRHVEVCRSKSADVGTKKAPSVSNKKVAISRSTNDMTRTDNVNYTT